MTRANKRKNTIMLNQKSFAFVCAIAAAVCAAAAQAGPPTKTAHPKVPIVKTAKAAKTAAKPYECPDCHDKFSVAKAKKAGMKCACCQTKLVKTNADVPAKKQTKTNKG